MQRPNRTLLLLVLLVSAAGCDITTTGPVRTDLHASDNDRLHPGGRVSFGILPKDEPLGPGILEAAATSVSEEPAATEASSDAPDSAAEPTAPAQESTRDSLALAVELDYRAGIGNDDQESITGAYFVEHGGNRIIGPANFDQDFTFHLATANLSAGMLLFDHFLIEALAGLSTSALHLVLRTPTQRTGDTLVGLGANGGLRLTVMPHPVVGLYGQAQLHLLYGLQHDRKEIAIPTFETGANLHLTRNLSVFGGWRWWQYDQEIEGASDIDDIDVNGPTFGAALRF